MGVIKGQNLRLKVNDKFIAFATSCTVHMSASLESSSTKDSTNDYEEQELTGVSWDISTDALYSVAEDSGGINGEGVLDLMIDPAKRKVTVSFLITEAGSTKNRTPATGTVFSGTAWVSDISINATNRQNTSYTVQLTGDGALTATPGGSTSDI